MSTEEKSLSPLEQRLEWVEQHTRDSADRVKELTALYHVLVRDLQNFGARLVRLEDKMKLLIPEVENCPKCHRKVSSGARKCGICNHVW